MTVVPPPLIPPIPPMVIYQADPSMMQTIRHKRDQIHQMAHQYMDRNIRVQTIDGHIYQGLLVNLDGAHLYLNVSGNPHMSRQFYNPYYNNVILPLVLYELLVITLL